MPGPSDTIVFNRTDAPCTVTWSENNLTNTAFRVDAGNVTFNLSGHSYYLLNSSPCSVGTSTVQAFLTVTNGIHIYMLGKTPAKISGPGSVLQVSKAYMELIDANVASNTTLRVDGTGTTVDGYRRSDTKCYGAVVVTNGAFLTCRPTVLCTGELFWWRGRDRPVRSTGSRCRPPRR